MYNINIISVAGDTFYPLCVQYKYSELYLLRNFLQIMDPHLHHIISRVLTSCDKYMRYDHHIHFINSYIRENRIPKGFKVNFHSNLVPDDVIFNSVLFNSSKKLMIKTIGHYKPQLSSLCHQIKLDLSEISVGHTLALGTVLDRVQSKIRAKANILHIRRRKKFTRDKLPNFKIHNEMPASTCIRICKDLLGHISITPSDAPDVSPDQIPPKAVVQLPIDTPSVCVSPISIQNSRPSSDDSSIARRLRSSQLPDAQDIDNSVNILVPPSQVSIPPGNGAISSRLRSHATPSSSSSKSIPPDIDATTSSQAGSTSNIGSFPSDCNILSLDRSNFAHVKATPDIPLAVPLAVEEGADSGTDAVAFPVTPLGATIVSNSRETSHVAPMGTATTLDAIVVAPPGAMTVSPLSAKATDPLVVPEIAPLESYAPINRSSSIPTLPDSFVSLCSKGPSFIPTPINIDWRSLKLDFDNFANRIRVLANSYDPKQDKSIPSNENINQNIDDLPPKKQKSRFRVPKSNIPAVEAYLTAIETALFKSVKKKSCKDNLTHHERSALSDWRQNVLFNPDSEVVLRMQDKGNRFLVVDKQEDIQKAKAQISRSSFLEVDEDLTSKHIKIVADWAEKWESRGDINKAWSKYIKNPDAVPGKNATLYKTHKDSVPVRLLTTGCNTPTENLSRFVEKHTAPLARNIPSRIRDTDHFLEIIDQINSDGLPDDVALVSFDIVNMFPSISNEKGVCAVAKALERRSKKQPSTRCIIEALEITLACNNSKFNGKHLLQTDGTAMGAPNSCSYADLATAPIDDMVYEAQKDTFPEIFVYYKFRDDVFNLWAGDVYRIDDFLDFLNSLDDTIKFTLEIGVLFKPTVAVPADVFTHLIDNVFPSSPSEILRSSRFEIVDNGLFLMWTRRISEIKQFSILLTFHSGYFFTLIIGKHKLRFLDVQVSFSNKQLATTVYSKPTSSHMYLDYSSCHPLGCKNGIAKGVALRLRRICSSDEEYLIQSEKYKSFLISRGHRIDLVQNEFNAIGLKSRSDVRQKTAKSSPGKAFFVAHFNPKGVNVSHLLKQFDYYLRNDPLASQIFPMNSIKVVNKRCQNLKELLVRADPYTIATANDIQLDNTHCKTGNKCDSCDNFLTHSTSFTCFATGRKFTVKKSLSCKTPHIVYLATCKNCGKQGVGLAKNFPSRLSTYKTHSREKYDGCGVSIHWNRVCRQDSNPVAYMSFQLIDCVDNTGDMDDTKIQSILDDKERFWIGTLVTMQKGMNNSNDWNKGRKTWSAAAQERRDLTS